MTYHPPPPWTSTAAWVVAFIAICAVLREVFYALAPVTP